MENIQNLQLQGLVINFDPANNTEVRMGFRKDISRGKMSQVITFQGISRDGRIEYLNDLRSFWGEVSVWFTPGVSENFDQL